MSDPGEVRFGQRRPVFDANQPRYVVCSEVSEVDCGRVMAFDAEHCGDPTHVRYVPPDGELGEARSVRRAQRRRPRLVVDDEYDDVEHVWGEPRTIDESFVPGEVWVARDVQASFCSYHDTSPEEAIANLRLVVERAVVKRRFHRTPQGFHVLVWNGFKVTLTPDLQAVVEYRTTHYERTPQMVADGVRSRMKGAHRNAAGVPRRKGTGRLTSSERQVELIREAVSRDGWVVGTVLDGVVQGVVAFGVFVTLGEATGLVHKSNIPADMVEESGLAVLERGDPIRVRIESIDIDAGRVGLELANPE